MEITYTMIGSDGQQYGPIALAQMKTWILEGRIAGDTRIMRSDTNSWLTAAQYPELGLGAIPTQATQASPPPPMPGTPGVIRAPSVSTVDPMLQRRVNSAGRWFFWIAGLSLVNTFMATSGSVFLVGLAVTIFISGPGIGNALGVAVAGVFVLFGVFARKQHEWSFILGMILYGLDALLAAYAQVWLMVAFHVFVLFWLFQGLRASRQLKAMAAAA